MNHAKRRRSSEGFGRDAAPADADQPVVSPGDTPSSLTEPGSDPAPIAVSEALIPATRLASRNGRDLDVDAVKGALIVLVVFGHLLEYFVARDSLCRAVFCVVYVFHIPLFVLLSGLWARAALTAADYHAMFARLLLPMACLQVVYLALIQVVQGHAVQHLLDPQWMLWFFLSLCAWRIVLPLAVHIPAGVVVFLGIAVAAGFSSAIGYQLSASRTLYFLPFFLAGYFYRGSLRQVVRRWRWACVLALVITAAITAYWSLHGLDRVALFGSQGYEIATAWGRLPAVGRLGVMALSAVGAVGFWAIVPWTWRPLAHLGRRTLSIFALHGFPVIVCLKVLSMTHLAPRPYLIVVLLVVAAALAWALSYVDRPFTSFFDGLATRLSKYAHPPR